MALEITDATKVELDKFEAAKTTFHAAIATFHEARKAKLVALKNNYLEQFKQLDKDSPAAKALTVEFLRQVEPMVGTNWISICNQQHPEGGSALTQCLHDNGEIPEVVTV